MAHHLLYYPGEEEEDHRQWLMEDQRPLQLDQLEALIIGTGGNGRLWGSLCKGSWADIFVTLVVLQATL